MPTSRRKKIIFELQAGPGNDVWIAGTFNGWNPRQKKMTYDELKGVYTATLSLTEGLHEYKFVVNDTWCIDPACPDWTPNGVGSLNSVITVA